LPLAGGVPGVLQERGDSETTELGQLGSFSSCMPLWGAPPSLGWPASRCCCTSEAASGAYGWRGGGGGIGPAASLGVLSALQLQLQLLSLLDAA
jgi:hypothetical protein